MSQLSGGLCQRLQTAQAGDDIFDEPHTVQFLSVKKVQPAPGAQAANDRYRIIISDGEHFLQSMLATQLNHMVTDEQIGKNTVAVIEKVTCNFVQEKRSVRARYLPFIAISDLAVKTDRHSCSSHCLP